MSNKWVVPSMNVFTHKVLAPAEIAEISTGSGIFAGSPIVPTSFACHFIVGVVADEPEFRGQRRRGDRPIVGFVQRPADFELARRER